jgi:DNA modification methylase
MNGLNKIEILQGDALNLLSNVASNSIDVVIADPPYNLGKDYGNDSDKKCFTSYLDFSRNWISECCRVLKPSGTIYIFMGVRFISYIYTILEQDYSMIFNSWITWHYTQGVGKTKGFSPRHDDILMFTKTKDFLFNIDNIRIPQKHYRSINNMNGANPGDVWQFSHVHYSSPEREKHPTQKPEALIERMILASSNENDNILDPFAGSGTTLRVAKVLNRNCLGFELNSDYVRLIEDRIQKTFDGFDSFDDRKNRIPLSLKEIRTGLF